MRLEAMGIVADTVIQWTQYIVQEDSALTILMRGSVLSSAKHGEEQLAMAGLMYEA